MPTKKQVLASIEKHKKRIEILESYLNLDTIPHLKVGRPRKELPIKVCPVCQTPFRIKSHKSKRKYCSEECSHKKQLERLSAIGNKAIQIREANPCATLQAIGTQVGLSRERVRQILKKHDKPTIHWKPSTNKYYCMDCGKPTPKPLCPDCNRARQWVDVACDHCGELHKERVCLLLSRISHGKREHIFCDRHCLGKYMGKHYGFANMKRHLTPRKYDYNMVWQKTTETGYGALRLSRVLNIPTSTITYILRTMSNTHHMTILHAPTTHKSQNPRKLMIRRKHIMARWLKHLNFTDAEIIKTLGCSKGTISRALYRRRHGK